ncbi:putative F-box protein At3g61730 [Carex rostrata]
MGLTLSSYYQWLNPFNSNLSRKREREEEEENGGRGPMLTYRRRKRTSKIGEMLTYYRRRKRMSNSEGGCEGEEEKEIVHQSSNKRGREGGDLSVQEERRVKKERTIAPCSSPQASFITPHSALNGYDMDLWTEVAKHLDGRELLMLSFTNRWFNRLISQDYIWKYACLRDMGVPAPCHTSFPWKEIYASAFDGTHAYCFRQQDKHIDWMRIGSFYLDSPFVLLTETLSLPNRIPRPGTDAKRSIELTGTCSVTNAKTGIWIADLQLVRCPVCNLNTCEGTMQVLDARHMELFLEEGYLTETWQYEDIGINRIPTPSEAAIGGIFDISHLSSPRTAKILNAKSWVGPPTDWQPKAKISFHGVAVNTNLQPNDGIVVKYQVMKDNSGNVVSIRISQQLI